MTTDYVKVGRCAEEGQDGEKYILLPVGRGAQRRSLDVPSPHLTGTITRYTQGVLVGTSYRLHVFKFHTGILAGVVENVFNNFIHKSPDPMMSRFIQLSKLLFYDFFFIFTMEINRQENFVENLLHLAIDRHPICPNRAQP